MLYTIGLFSLVLFPERFERVFVAVGWIFGLVYFSSANHDCGDPGRLALDATPSTRWAKEHLARADLVDAHCPCSWALVCAE